MAALEIAKRRCLKFLVRINGGALTGEQQHRLAILFSEPSPGMTVGSYFSVVLHRITEYLGIEIEIVSYANANNGDIFLDEISSLKLDLQAKILRTLQEKEVCRVGGNSTTKVEFRVLAATNEDLEMLVTKGLFRMDLFHRLCVIHLRMPPLRERLDDIPLLVKHFIEKHTKAGHHKEVEPAVFEELKRYNWPGNIRELENIIHNLIVMAPNGMIRMEDLAEWSNKKPDTRQLDCNLDESISFEDCIRRAQKGYIENVLKITKGNKSKAAERLNMSRSTLHTKLKELGVA